MKMGRVFNRWLIVLGALTVIFGACVFLLRDSRGSAVYYEGDNTVPLCANIELDLLKCNVRLIPYDGGDIRFCYKSAVPITVMRGDNRLVVSESDEFRLMLLSDGRQDFNFTLYLPRAEYDVITVYTSAGSVYAGGVTAEQLNIVTKSGNIEVEGCAALTRLTSGTGDIRLCFDSVTEGSGIEARSGNAEIILPRGSSVALSYETETGSFKSDMIKGHVEGSYMFSFSGGETLIYADVGRGTLTVNEKTGE